MKHYLKHLLLCFCLFAGTNVLAYDAIIDGIYYNFSGDEAIVTYLLYNNSGNSSAYSGNIVIPPSVNYNGKPYSVTSIGEYAFYFCSGLTSITIPNSVTSIGNYVFYDCSGLTSITIPNGVTSISKGAFWTCSGLTSITIPNSVTSIESSAFYGCGSLTSLTIPSSVTSIGEGAFSYCSGLTSVEVEAGNTTYDSRGNCNAIIETATNTLIAGCQNTTIPSSVTSIGDKAFYGCRSLTSLTIPSNVKNIGDWAFYNSSLTSVTIPSSVTSIGDCAFLKCSSLASIIIPSSVTSIGEEAFEGCSGLTDVYCYAENVPMTSSDAFTSSPIASATLHVPAASLEAYKTTDPWKKFGTIEAIQASPNIVFADANVKALCVASWDLSGDGELDEAEAKTITYLGETFRGNYQIGSFDGNL